MRNFWNSPFAPAIQWDDSRNKDLIFFVAPGIIPFELVSGSQPRNTGANGCYRGITPIGPAWESNAYGTGYLSWAITPQIKTMGNRSTIIVWASLDTCQSYAPLLSLPAKTTWTSPYHSYSFIRNSTTSAAQFTIATGGVGRSTINTASGFLNFTGELHQYAITRNGTAVRYFKDGELFGSGTMSSSNTPDFTNCPEAVLFTRNTTAVGESGNGRISQALIYNRTYTDWEIKQNFQDPWGQVTYKQRKIYIVLGSGTDTPISPVVGSYALTGNAATTTVHRVLSPVTGTYTLTGNAATVTATIKLIVALGTYALTGNTLVGIRTYVNTATLGTYFLTGNTATLAKQYLLVNSLGTYAVTGNTAIFSVAKLLVTTLGTYNVTGQTATLVVDTGFTISANLGTYSLTGNAAVASRTTILISDLGTYAVTGNVTTLVRGVITPAALGTYSLSGNAITISQTYIIDASTGAYVYTGNAATSIVASIYRDTILTLSDSVRNSCDILDTAANTIQITEGMP